MELAYASATQLAQGLRTGQYGSRELLDMYIRRIEALDGKINAVVVRDFERARRAADAADAARARGESLGPLHGLPMTVKESFEIAGLPATWGFPTNRGNIGRNDAEAVRRLKAAGAVVFGKTNIPLFLSDYQSANEVYGTTSNPWDLARTCGGSSGGSAAALAAGFTGLEWGSDIGGSLRVPAHYCGIYAHKPTWGIVPSAGHWVQPGPRTDVSVVGPMARSAADLELALGITAGPDEAETRAWRLQLPPPAHKSLGEFRVGILLNAAECEVDAQVQEAIASVGRYLEHEGVKVTWNARPDIDFGQVMLDATMMMRVASARTMPESAYDELLRERAALRADDDGPRARYVRGVTATHREWLQAHARRYALQKAWERFFDDVDVLLCPIASTVAPLHTTTDPVVRTMEVNGRTLPVFNQILWAGLAGVPYLPSTAVPAGRSPEGLPIGVQIIGRQYGDLTTIALARMLEQGFRGFEPPAL